MTKATGIEQQEPPESSNLDTANNAIVLKINNLHLKLIQVEFRDQTDHHNELVNINSWLLHSSERSLSLNGNCFIIEDTFTNAGEIWIMEAPLRPVRESTLEIKNPDLVVIPKPSEGFEFQFHTFIDHDLNFNWKTLKYEGGEVGRIIALQEWKRTHKTTRTPKLLSNTWGDRSRDGRISEAFLKEEIPKAAQLGIEIFQLDSGWQKGIDANSVHAHSHGGVWSGFWDTDPDFWTPHPERFPNGLESSFALMSHHGIEPGLWYAPDSAQDFKNWSKDAHCVLSLHRRYGVNYFKFDSIDVESQLGWKNLSQLFQTIHKESQKEIIIDLDITAGNRPGYWYPDEDGVFFLENRYTDWGNYWPHQTLRNLWQLSHWIDPRRLRIEFLNNLRNPEKYGSSPLAPQHYSLASLFAITMAANPLAWFEISGLSNEQIKSLAPIVTRWKAIKEELFQCQIIPFGKDPDGTACAGFLFVDNTSLRFALCFRQLNDQCNWEFDIKKYKLNSPKTNSKCLAGEGVLEVTENSLLVTIPSPLGFGLFGF